jgi:hypothetical protein
MPRDPAAPTPLPGEIARLLQQYRLESEEAHRKAAHTVRWYGQRLDKIQRELADRYATTASYPLPPTAPSPETLDLSKFGDITRTIILKTIEDREAKKAVELLGSFRGFGWILTKTIVTVGVLAVLGVLATVLVVQAARTMNDHHDHETPVHEGHE